jgi:hypothetical protein
MDFDTLRRQVQWQVWRDHVMDDSRNMVEMLNNINEFYAHESCGHARPAARAAFGCRRSLNGCSPAAARERSGNPWSALPTTSRVRRSARLVSVRSGQPRASWRNFRGVHGQSDEAGPATHAARIYPTSGRQSGGALHSSAEKSRADVMAPAANVRNLLLMNAETPLPEPAVNVQIDGV